MNDLAALHLDTVAVAYRDFFPPEATKPDADVLRRLWLQDVGEAHDVIVAVDDGAIVGSVVARASGDVARLHVHPNRWREGIGRHLHDAAVAALRFAGHAESGLWVIDRNQPARTLYEAAGWRLDPTRELAELGVIEVRYVLTL